MLRVPTYGQLEMEINSLKEQVAFLQNELELLMPDAERFRFLLRKLRDSNNDLRNMIDKAIEAQRQVEAT